MKICLSSKNDPRKKHVVLVCARDERHDAEVLINDVVLENLATTVEERNDNGESLFRFNLERYLEKLTLTFPFAELSPGIHRRLKRAEEIRLDGFEVPELEIPGFTGTLYDFQKIAVAMLTDPDYAKAHGHTGVVDFLNDSMGLGKTFTILATIASLQAYPALIVVPNNAKYTWLEVIQDFYPKLSVGVYDTQEQNVAERDEIIRERRDITIVNIEAIRASAIHKTESKYSEIVGYNYANPALFDFVYEYAVLDEAHLVKNPYSQIARGFFQLDAEEWWCAMTGTPIMNRVEEVWSVLHKLYPKKFPNYNRFERELCIKRNNKIIGYHPDKMKELRDFLNDRSLRRRREQVLKDLPEVIYKPVLVTLSPEERKLYDKIEDELLLEMEDGTVKDIGGALPQITRLKQACFSPELYGGAKKSSKMEELKNIVRELVDSGEKCIIFSQWEEACKIIKRELSEFSPAYVTGKVKNRSRMEEIRKFNEEVECPVYIGTIGANREAINLGSATYVIFTDLGWTPFGNDQAVGRSAAGGLRGAEMPEGTVVTVIELQAEDSYEQNVETLLKRKRLTADRMTDRDGGAIRNVEQTSLGDLIGTLSKRAQKIVGKKFR